CNPEGLWEWIQFVDRSANFHRSGSKEQRFLKNNGKAYRCGQHKERDKSDYPGVTGDASGQFADGNAHKQRNSWKDEDEIMPPEIQSCRKGQGRSREQAKQETCAGARCLMPNPRQQAESRQQP